MSEIPDLGPVAVGAGLWMATLGGPLIILWRGYRWLQSEVDTRVSLHVEREVRRIEDARRAAIEAAEARVREQLQAEVARLQADVRSLQQDGPNRAQLATLLVRLGRMADYLDGGS